MFWCILTGVENLIDKINFRDLELEKNIQLDSNIGL